MRFDAPGQPGVLHLDRGEGAGRLGGSQQAQSRRVDVRRDRGPLLLPVDRRGGRGRRIRR